MKKWGFWSSVFTTLLILAIGGVGWWITKDINVFLSIVSIGVTVIFGFIADRVADETKKLAEYANQLAERNQEFTEKFSPVDISNLKETSVKLLDTFSLGGLSINIIRNYVSGSFKDIRIAWYSRAEKASMEQLFMESLISDLDGSGRQLVLNLTDTWEVPNVHQKDQVNTGKAELLFYLGETPAVNLLFIVVEDYQGIKQYIVYVLYQSTDGEHKLLCCYPLKQWSLFSRKEIVTVYDRIDFQNDPFWKGKGIHTINGFRKYILRQLHNLRQEG